MEVPQVRTNIRRWLKDQKKMSVKERNERADAIDAALACAIDGESTRSQFRFLRENMDRGLSAEQVAFLGMAAHQLVHPRQG